MDYILNNEGGEYSQYIVQELNHPNTGTPDFHICRFVF